MNQEENCKPPENEENMEPPILFETFPDENIYTEEVLTTEETTDMGDENLNPNITDSNSKKTDSETIDLYLKMDFCMQDIKKKTGEQHDIDWNEKHGRMLARKSFDGGDLRQLTESKLASSNTEQPEADFHDQPQEEEGEVEEVEVEVEEEDEVVDEANGGFLYQQDRFYFTKREASRHRKKERKIVLTFLKQYLPEMATMLLQKSLKKSRTLLVDGRDFSGVLSTEDLIILINRSIQDGPDRCSLLSDPENLVKDIFVLPSKKFTVVRLKESLFATEINTFFTVNKDLKSLGTNRFVLVPDEVFDATLKRYEAEVKGIIDKFHIKNRPGGLGLFDNFIDRMEEYLLLGFSRESFELAHYHGKVSKLKNREAIHYGFTFDYEQNTIVTDPSKLIHSDLPEVCQPFLSRMIGIIPHPPDQLTINRYDGSRGDHIPFHTDTHSMCTEWIVSLSLGSDVTMAWRDNSGREVFSYLPARSLMVMSGDARYRWKHGIAKTTLDLVPMKNYDRLMVSKRKERFSWTFRRTRPGFLCDCPDCLAAEVLVSTIADEEESASKIPTSPSYIKLVEERHVHEVYSKVSAHFSSTRNHCWPKVVKFINSLPAGSLLLDVGCGNGRFLSANPQIFSFGTDRCENLLKLGRERGFEVFTEDCRALVNSVRGGVFDAVLSIAVLHHLATEERRLEAIEALIHLLTLEGLALIYVWAFEQKQEGRASKYLKGSKGDRKETSENEPPEVDPESSLPIHCNRTQFEQQDVMVPWNDKDSNERYLRFYHLFRKGELEQLVARVGGVELVKSFYDQGNWCVVLRKLY